MGLRDANASNDRRYNWTKMFGTIARNENGDPTDPCAGDSGDFIVYFCRKLGSTSEHKITASDANQTPIQAVLSSGKVRLPVQFLLGLYKEVATTAGSHLKMIFSRKIEKIRHLEQSCQEYEVI